MTPIVFISMKYSKEVWVAAEISVHTFYITPYIAHISIGPRNGTAYIVVVINSHIVIVKFKGKQLVMLKPVLLPGGWRRLRPPDLHAKNKKTSVEQLFHS